MKADSASDLNPEPGFFKQRFEFHQSIFRHFNPGLHFIFHPKPVIFILSGRMVGEEMHFKW